MPEIIIGVDGSARGEDAIAFGRRIAGITGATLTLASAFPYEDWPTRAASRSYRDFLRNDTIAMLDRMRASMDGADVPAHAIADPSPARALHLLAERDRAALVVIGSSHRGRVGRVLAGGTADRLLHGSPCPVAIVPSGYRTREPASMRTIGVGYDGSEESRAAAIAAAELARRVGAEVSVIRVFDANAFVPPVLGASPGFEASVEQAEKLAREDLEMLVAGMPPEVGAQGVFTLAAPARELATRSEGLDLLLLGSRGYGPLLTVLLGSVSHAVVRRASSPVIVLPRGARRGLDELLAPAEEASA